MNKLMFIVPIICILIILTFDVLLIVINQQNIHRWWKTTTDSAYGVVREVTVVTYNGNELWHYVGKVDIHQNGNETIIDDEQGLRHSFINVSIVSHEVEVD